MSEPNPSRASHPGASIFWTLVRTDRASAAWRWWALAGVVMGLIMLSPGFSHDNPPLYFIFWCWCILMLVSTRASMRCQPLALGLPLSPRLLWASRATAIVLLIFAVILPAAITLAVGRLLGAGQATLQALDVSLWLHLGAGYALALALIQSLAPTLHESPKGWLVSVYALVLAGGLFQQPALTYQGSMWIVVTLAGLAVALGLRTYCRLPRTLLLLPSQPREADRSPRHDRPAGIGQRWPIAPARGPRTATRWVLSIAYWHWFTPLGLPILFFFGAWRSGYLAGGLHGPALTVMTLGMLFALFRISFIQITNLDQLPIPRRRIFAALTLPGALTLAAGIVLGSLIEKGLSRMTLVEYGTKRCDPQLDVRVPFEFWEASRHGSPLAGVASSSSFPCAASSTRVFRWGNVVLYSPFHVPPGSPPQVAARALSRAAAAVYGVEIPHEELQQRYFVASPDGATALRDGPFRLEEDFPDLRPRSWTRTLPTHLAVLGIVWFLWLAVAMPAFSGWAPGIQRFRQVAVISSLFILMLLPMILSIAGVTTEWKISAFSAILIRKLTEGIPLPTGLLWLASLIVVAGAYRLARARFEALELIPLRVDQW